MGGFVGYETQRPHDYLERLAASDLGSTYKQLVLDRLRITAGDHVVDLGCGLGADLIAFAEAVGPTGTVTGIDVDAEHVRRARERAQGCAQVRVVDGDIHVLAIPDSTVDRVHTDRTLQHVAEPARVLREARRVLRTGGRAAFAEPDWDTLVVDHPDRALTRTYTGFVADQVVRNGDIGRRLAGLAQDAGFTVAEVLPVTAVFRDVGAADQVLGLYRVTSRAVAAGAFTETQSRAWLAHLAEAPFFAAATLFVVVADA